MTTIVAIHAHRWLLGRLLVEHYGRWVHGREATCTGCGTTVVLREREHQVKPGEDA